MKLHAGSKSPFPGVADGYKAADKEQCGLEEREVQFLPNRLTRQSLISQHLTFMPVQPCSNISSWNSGRVAIRECSMKHVLIRCLAVAVALASATAQAEPIGSAPVYRPPAQQPPISQEEILQIVRSNPQAPAIAPSVPPPISQEEILRIVRSNPQAPATAPSASPSIDRAAQLQAELNQSLEAIARSDSRSWWTNSYDVGSMHNSYVRASSPDGTTVIARGFYTYNGGTRGWVDARIVNGQLDCIEYWDTWMGCRRANSGTNAYARVVVAALVVAVVAVAANGTNGEGSAGGSSFSDDENRGSHARATDQPPTRRPEPGERIGGENGLYGCASPPCWDRQPQS
jgi:hypothetical protein